MELEAGMDFRQRAYRREVFLRFYSFHLRTRAHPGCVYYALPAMAEAGEWDAETRCWAAWLNGNTQNPVTTLLLLQAAPRPRYAEAAVAFWNRHYNGLQWDTDRRYHKARFADALRGYNTLTGGDGGVAYWRRHGGSWDAAWAAALALPYMGRLSAWSYLEYLHILGVVGCDADSLLLGDVSGSRSHRNGLALVTGHDDWIDDPHLGGRPDFRHDVETLAELEWQSELLLAEARRRNPEHARDVTRLTLESALCTYKSWHKPRRRYPGVYNDLFYNRLVHGENRFGYRFGVLWDARRDALPARLRLEENPCDPGAVTVKQNHYLRTGQVINMTVEWPCFANDFEVAVAACAYGKRARPWT